MFSALGAEALGLTAAVIAGVDVPLLPDQRAAFIVLGALIASKLGIGVLYRAAG